MEKMKSQKVDFKIRKSVVLDSRTRKDLSISILVIHYAFRSRSTMYF